MPSVGFLPPDDWRVRGTVRAIEQRLFVDGLVMRYDTKETQDIRPAQACKARRTAKSLAVLEESPALGSFCQN
jgi:GH15 family glucan-1,4-alpha-glucosidase